ncbi:MAG: ethylbenzene dehydrogenase-related protein [Halopseudomonas sp.]
MRFKGLMISCMVAPAIAVAATPVNTFFSVAVTENSHNHIGENLLYLDFQSSFDSSAVSHQRVVSPKVVDNSIQLDASLSDWQPEQFSKIAGRVMNNYPLSEFYDAVPTDIELASAHDSQHLYFAIRFKDANHDRSSNRNRWINDGGSWSKQQHVAPTPGSPAASAVNVSDTLAGNESEDRVFFMFPIVDKQLNFRDQGVGCAGYCHTNLADSGNPKQHLIGEDVVAMHTSLEGDLADIWHWTSTRSAPSRTLKDGHLIYAKGSDSGRKGDPGKSPAIDNDLKKLKLNGSEGLKGPAYISHADYEKGLYDKLSHTTAQLTEDDLLKIKPGMELALGSSVPYTIHRQASGSRADVEVASHFDPATQLWTLEFKRLLDTGDAEHDRIFTQGTPASPPTVARPNTGDSQQGQKLYQSRKCEACHGQQGEGVFEDDRWLFPRIQRASGSLIFKTAEPHRPKRLQALAYLRQQGAEIPDALMPSIPLTPQEAEDIAAWLQQQFIAIGR